MNPNVCNNCGGDYEHRNGRWICRWCGSYRPENISNEEITLLYNAAQKLRLCDFDEAEKQYSDIIEKYPKNPNGYWGRLLSKYGIKYEEDFDGRKIPTCYAASMESIISDKDYGKAIEFADAINDLYGAILEQMTNKTMIHICDGIVGLEGEGPSSAGITKKANIILTSFDAVSLDRVACEVTKLNHQKLFITNTACDRKIGEGDINNIEILGDSLNDFQDLSFLEPKDSLSNFGLKILKIKPLRNLLLEHPVIEESKCIKCGECVKICPPKTMIIKKKDGKVSFPKLKAINCIRCWCCSEVCPQNAIKKNKRPLLGKILFK